MQCHGAENLGRLFHGNDLSRAHPLAVAFQGHVANKRANELLAFGRDALAPEQLVGEGSITVHLGGIDAFPEVVEAWRAHQLLNHGRLSG